MKYNIGDIIVIMKSFQNTPIPCFGYIYGTYTIDEVKGYNIISFYTESIDNISYNCNVDLRGFSQEEMDKYIIPYMNDSEEVREISKEIKNHINITNYNTRYIDKFTLDDNVLPYLNNNRLKSYMRNYYIDKII